MKVAPNLKGIIKKECELETKLREKNKERVYNNKMSDEEFVKYKYYIK